MVARLKGYLAVLKLRKNKATDTMRRSTVRTYATMVGATLNSDEYASFLKLDLPRQRKIVQSLVDLSQSVHTQSYAVNIFESTKLPTQAKKAAIVKINHMKNTEPDSGCYFKNKAWLDTLMTIPIGTYASLPVTIADGSDATNGFLQGAKKTLDESVHGLDDAKMQILLLLGQLIVNPTSACSAIAIHGPPGTGKTSLIQNGISKILNRPFAFVALGGATNSSYLKGHAITYEGSIYGKIVQILIESKCMNPIIYFDELDKISESSKGSEIINTLIHMTDTTQNSHFRDNYFTEIDLDLSKCLFIFSYNDESKISPVLRDRMYNIRTSPFTRPEKSIIATRHLIPSITRTLKFDPTDIIFPAETIAHLLESPYCAQEKGVRNLKRSLEAIAAKLNLSRLVLPNEMRSFTGNAKSASPNVEFPVTVTPQMATTLVGSTSSSTNSVQMYGMYV